MFYWTIAMIESSELQSRKRKILTSFSLPFLGLFEYFDLSKFWFIQILKDLYYFIRLEFEEAPRVNNKKCVFLSLPLSKSR